MSVPHPDESRLYAFLDQLGIAHETVEHDPVFTVEEGQHIKDSLEGGHTKNLFLKDKAGQFALICAISDTPVRLNKLHPHIGTKRLSFGREEALYNHLRVRPGSVTFFSVFNDTDTQVRLILDKALFNFEHVWFHPLRNSASTRIASKDLIRFAESVDHPPQILDIATIGNEPKSV